jgi:glyoxylase-like metal-dependent hydrolase (beta-lactamase superfamily II)
VNTGDKLILFDTGMGTSQLFGPTTGRQQKSMVKAGIKPEDIDAVVCSHAHIDYIGGIVDANDKPLFPNAQIYIAQSDLDYWTDEGKLGGPAQGLDRPRAQEPATGPGSRGVLQGRPGISARRPGDRGTRAHGRPPHFMVSSAGKSFAFLGWNSPTTPTPSNRRQRV